MGLAIFAALTFRFLFLLLSGIQDWIVLLFTMDEKLIVLLALVVMIGVPIIL